MDRRIAHIDLDSFFVSVERLLDPKLIGKPVIVGGTSSRGVVCSASYEARKFGVHSAMPTVQAAKLCPHAIFVWSGPGEYHKYSRLVTDIIREKVPVVEKASIDEFYLDLTGMDRFYPVFPYLVALKKQIRQQTGLPVSFALATNKLISKIATNEAKPDGEIEILPGTEREWLAPMEVGKLPGCGTKMVGQLKQKGITTIGGIATLDVKVLENWFGKWGTDLHRKALGIDEGGVHTEHEPKSISSEETFHEDVGEIGFMEKEIARLTEKIGYELREEGKLAGCVTVKIRYDNFETVTRQQTIDFTASDVVFIRKAKEIFRNFYQQGRKVRLLGVRLSQLESDSLQLDLFQNAAEEKQLFEAIDQIKKSFGKGSIQRAASHSHDKGSTQGSTDPLWIDRNAKSKEEEDS